MVKKEKRDTFLRGKDLTKSIINTAPSIIMVLDTKGRIVTFNPYMERLSGYKLKEVVGKDWFSTFLSKNEAAKIKKIFRKAVSNIHTRGNVNPIISKHGKEIFVEWHDTTLKGYDGRVEGVLSIGQDITERVRTERALSEIMELQERVEKETKIGGWEMDLVTGRSKWTKGTYEIVEIAKGKPVPGIKEHVGYYLPEYRGLVKRSIEQLIKTKRPMEFEAAFRTANGNLKWGCATGRAVMVKGKAVKIRGTFRDITEQKLAAEEKEKAEKLVKSWITRYELVVEASGQAAYDYCVATGGIIWGKSIKKVLGYSSQEMTGGFSQWKEMLHPGDREATLETLYAAEKDCAYWDHEYRMRHKKGEYRWVRDRGFFVRGEKGTVERQLGMIEDINDRKRNEIELKSARELVQRWNKELEHRVEERTEELRRSQGQLIQAEKLSSVGQLSAGVAHELNSPLTGLLTMLGSYLKKTDKNKAEYNEIREMIEASKHMARIVKDLGTFARETDDVFTETDLNEVINSTLNFIPHLFRKDKKTVRLKKELNTSIPAIKGNESRLRQVVLNLITNSCDAMPEGGKLTIRTGKTDGGKGVMMTFEDTGKGISEENIKKVFEPFFTTKQPGEGVGLGLSIVHGIIATHSGRIKIESEKGKRTKFTVIFPAAKRRRNNNGKKRKDTDSR